MESMQIVVPEGMAKKEWFTAKEFAAGVKASQPSLVEWIRVHPKFKQEFCQKIGSGSKRPRYLIFWKGIAEYIAQKNAFNGNKNRAGEQGFSEVKSKVAEQANQNIERKQSQLTPIQALLQSVQMMAQMEQRVDAHESKLLQLEEKIEAATEVLTSPVPVTNGQRQFLNDRVRKYCIEHDLPFHVVWRQVHEHVGLAAVHKYELKHYQAALKYVEKMYIETGLIW